MVEKYKHIIWDWNGTIINDVDLCVELINWLLKEKNLKTITKEEYKNIFTIPVKNYYAALGFDFDKEPFEVIGRRWMDEYEHRKFECMIYDGVVDVMEKINKLPREINHLIKYTNEKLSICRRHISRDK